MRKQDLVLGVRTWMFISVQLLISGVTLSQLEKSALGDALCLLVGLDPRYVVYGFVTSRNAL